MFWGSDATFPVFGVEVVEGAVVGGEDGEGAVAEGEPD